MFHISAKSEKKKMINPSRFYLIVAISLLCIDPLTAQHPVSLQFRTGVNLPTGQLGEMDLKTGIGFEGLLSYRFSRHFGAYTGWGWSRFGSSTTFGGDRPDIEETGYLFGMQLFLPVSRKNFDYLISAGGVYNHIETESSEGNLLHDSGHGHGWQAETGISAPVSARLRIIPTLRYRSLTRDINIDDKQIEMKLRYFSFGLAVSWSIGN